MCRTELRCVFTRREEHAPGCALQGYVKTIVVLLGHVCHRELVVGCLGSHCIFSTTERMQAIDMLNVQGFRIRIFRVIWRKGTGGAQSKGYGAGSWSYSTFLACWKAVEGSVFEEAHPACDPEGCLRIALGSHCWEEEHVRQITHLSTTWGLDAGPMNLLPNVLRCFEHCLIKGQCSILRWFNGISTCTTAIRGPILCSRLCPRTSAMSARSKSFILYIRCK